MKRVRILKDGAEYGFFETDVADIRPEVERMRTPGWGRPERWVSAQELEREGKTPTDAIDTRTTEIAGETTTSYLLPAEYTIEIQDITDEVRERKRQDYRQAREAQTDQEILAALGNRMPVTQIARALYHLAMSINVFGNATPEQQDASKRDLGTYLGMFQAVESAMARRDADIAAFNPDADP